MAKNEKNDWTKTEEKLQKDLTPRRFRHTLGVTYTACMLGYVYGTDPVQTRMAGLLHDCAKCIPNERKIELCRKEKIDITEYELENPDLLHSKLGVLVAADRYDISDPVILDAIRWHTTGRPEMTMLEKIVFIADYIEPNRDKAPRLDVIRRTAFQDIDLCTYMILKDTIDYLKEKPKSMDPTTLQAFEYYSRAVKH